MATPTPLVPSTGLNVVHLFCHPEGVVDAGAVRKAVDDAIASGLQVVTAAIMGAKADVCFMVLGEDLWDLRRFQSKIQAAGLKVAESYVSVTEVSEYAAGTPEHILQARLFPVLPPADMKAFCFYPMSKRRGDENNWYSLPYEERLALMRRARFVGTRVQGSGPASHHRIDGPGRLGVGRDALRGARRRPEGVRLHHAIRRGLHALRGVWRLLHRTRRHRGRGS
jgi:hypothetical protein